MNIKDPSLSEGPDVVLIGAGIMSATLGIMLKQLQPGISIEILERLEMIAGESSDAWNNAGTGHSALCELNYTPQKEDGSVDCSKAVSILESFEQSKQFWAWLVEQKILPAPENFITPIPHMSFVWGDENVDYLKKRWVGLTSYHPFKGMQYSEGKAQLMEWMPLVMEGRDANEKVAATRMEIGTDVNFGALTRSMIKYLDALDGVNLYLHHEVEDIDCQDDGTWEINVRDLGDKLSRKIVTKFVFIGAGGGSLTLLEKSDIPEGKGFGGFPVSGQWLRCTNPDIIKRHHAKVYGKASVGAPPMSVPHLDSRFIDGERALLFGPYAGFSTKFLKHGSFMDLPSSIKLSNIVPMVSAGLKNIPLTKYLVKEVMQSSDDRLEALQEYLPNAVKEDWELELAGQRVQVIKKDEEHGGGVLEFGTEVVTAADGSLAALLGASPGASTSVSIMLNLIQNCFSDNMKTEAWQQKAKEMIPSFGKKLIEHPELCDAMREWTSRVLELNQ
ncbi:MAG: malate:quinone oxidoreductase [Chitinophagaceae bacterium]